SGRDCPFRSGDRNNRAGKSELSGEAADGACGNGNGFLRKCVCSVGRPLTHGNGARRRSRERVVLDRLRNRRAARGEVIVSVVRGLNGMRAETERRGNAARGSGGGIDRYRRLALGDWRSIVCEGHGAGERYAGYWSDSCGQPDLIVVSLGIESDGWVGRRDQGYGAVSWVHRLGEGVGAGVKVCVTRIGRRDGVRAAQQRGGRAGGASGCCPYGNGRTSGDGITVVREAHVSGKVRRAGCSVYRGGKAHRLIDYRRIARS